MPGIAGGKNNWKDIMLFIYVKRSLAVLLLAVLGISACIAYTWCVRLVDAGVSILDRNMIFGLFLVLLLTVSMFGIFRMAFPNASSDSVGVFIALVSPVIAIFTLLYIVPDHRGLPFLPFEHARERDH